MKARPCVRLAHCPRETKRVQLLKFSGGLSLKPNRSVKEYENAKTNSLSQYPKTSFAAVQLICQIKRLL